MHYADFAEDEVRLTGRKFGCRLPKRQSQALLNAIKEYEANKWKEIGRRVGKPAKVSSLIPHDMDSALLSTSAGLRAVCEGALWRENLTTACFDHCLRILTREQTIIIHDSHFRF